MKKVKFQFAVQIQVVAFENGERNYLVIRPDGRILGLGDDVNNVSGLIQDLDSELDLNSVNTDN